MTSYLIVVFYIPESCDHLSWEDFTPSNFGDPNLKLWRKELPLEVDKGNCFKTTFVITEIKKMEVSTVLQKLRSFNIIPCFTLYIKGGTHQVHKNLCKYIL